MESRSTRAAVVVGAGPVGCLLACLLTRRGFAVELYEKRSDLRKIEEDGDRSINLVLTNRGLRALAMLGVREEVLGLTVPVLGRMMHDVEGELTFQPYGKDDSERNHSVSRKQLNEFLLDEAERAGVTIFFEHPVTDGDMDEGELEIAPANGEPFVLRAPVIFGCDGAPSRVRRALVRQEGFEESVELLDYGYKEVLFAADERGEYAMRHDVLHIWPRGHHMLMGLANLDGSFTGTIYLPNEGADSFAQLSDEASVQAFFEEHYPDAIDLAPDLIEEMVEHPVGVLGTVRCWPWQLDGRVLLLGDASHGIVPFFGQGLNSGFEDCALLEEIWQPGKGLEEIFEEFERLRKPSTDAIADMALENFVEMRDRVGDERFLLRKKIQHRIEQQMPELFRSRYAMVVYSSLSYRQALELGQLQDEVLDVLLEEYASAEEVEMSRARELVEEHLVPYYQQQGIDLVAAFPS